MVQHADRLLAGPRANRLEQTTPPGNAPDLSLTHPHSSLAATAGAAAAASASLRLYSRRPVITGGTSAKQKRQRKPAVADPQPAVLTRVGTPPDSSSSSSNSRSSSSRESESIASPGVIVRDSFGSKGRLVLPKQPASPPPAAGAAATTASRAAASEAGEEAFGALDYFSSDNALQQQQLLLPAAALAKLAAAGRPGMGRRPDTGRAASDLPGHATTAAEAAAAAAASVEAQAAGPKHSRAGDPQPTAGEEAATAVGQTDTGAPHHSDAGLLPADSRFDTATAAAAGHVAPGRHQVSAENAGQQWQGNTFQLDSRHTGKILQVCTVLYMTQCSS